MYCPILSLKSYFITVNFEALCRVWRILCCFSLCIFALVSVSGGKQYGLLVRKACYVFLYALHEDCDCLCRFCQDMHQCGGCRDSPERFLCSDASGKYVPISFSWYVFVMLTYSIVGIFSICFFVKMKMFFSHDRFLFPFCSFLHLFVFVLSYTFAPGRTGPFRLSCLIFIDRFMLQYTYSILFSFFVDVYMYTYSMPCCCIWCMHIFYVLVHGRQGIHCEGL